MKDNRRRKNCKHKWGDPKNEHVEAISKIYEGWKQLGELAPFRYGEARKQILDGITAATRAMQLRERLSA